MVCRQSLIPTGRTWSFSGVKMTSDPWEDHAFPHCQLFISTFHTEIPLLRDITVGSAVDNTSWEGGRREWKDIKRTTFYVTWLIYNLLCAILYILRHTLHTRSIEAAQFYLWIIEVLCSCRYTVYDRGHTHVLHIYEGLVYLLALTIIVEPRLLVVKYH